MDNFKQNKIIVMRFWLRSLLLVLAKITGVFISHLQILVIDGILVFVIIFFNFTNNHSIFLAMFYNANADIVFNVVFDLTSEVIMVDGWECSC